MYIQNDSNINSTMTREYIAILRNLGLVNTGNLVANTKLQFILDDKGKGEIKIHSTEYLQFLDNKYQITDKFLKTTIISNLINSIIGDFVVDNLWNLDKIQDDVKIKFKYYW